MIIAYPLCDLKSLVTKNKVYQKKGVPTRVVSICNDTMMILENKSGERFAANKNKLVWTDTASP